MRNLMRVIGAISCCVVCSVSTANSGAPWGTDAVDDVTFSETRSEADQQGMPSGPEVMGASVAVTTGNKVQQQRDFQTGGQAPLALIRTYNQGWVPGQKWPLAGIFGNLWVSNYDTKLAFENTDGQVCYPKPNVLRHCSTDYTNLSKVHLHDGDGARYSFNKEGTVWRTKPQAIAAISEADGGWLLAGEDDSRMFFNTNGELQWAENRFGQRWTYSYTAPYKLTTVTSPSGRAINFTWTDSVVTSVNDPTGKSYNYSYDSNGLLWRVTYPNVPADTVVYDYESRKLSKITVNGDGYATYVYDSDGNVKESTLAGGVGRSTYLYTSSWTEFTNAAGAKLRYTFVPINGENRVRYIDRSGVTSSANARTEFTYDANGFVDYKIDWRGIKTDYSYAANGQLQEVVSGILATDPAHQRITQFTWHPTLNRIATIRRYGATLSQPLSETVYEYFASGRLESVTTYDRSPLGNASENRSVAYAYAANPTSKLLTSATVAGTATGDYTYTFDSKGDLVSIANSLGHKTSYANYNGLGQPGRITDANDLVTDYLYDERGRTKSVSQVIAGAVRVTMFEYSGLGLVTKTTFPDLTVENRIYDSAGLLRQLDRGTGDFQSYAYNSLGKIAGIRYVRRTETGVQCSSTTAQTTYGEAPEYLRYFDESAPPGISGLSSFSVSELTSYLPIPDPLPPLAPLLPVVAYQNAGGLTGCSPSGTTYRDTVYFSRSLAHDSLGRVTSVSGNNGQVTSYSYDQNGNLVTMTDSLARTTSFEYSAQDQRTKVTDALGQFTYFAYDGLGNVAGVTDPRGQVTSYFYNGFGELVELNSPDTGVTTFTYDGEGRPKTTMRADGMVIDQGTYDALGRALTIAAGTESQVFTYDSCANGKGRLCTISDASGSTSYAYKINGLMETQTSVIAGAAYSLAWDHDAKDRVTTLTYPGGTQAKYQYDSFDRVKGVDAVIGGLTKPVVGGFAFYPYGPESSFSYGNGLVRTLWRDLDYRQTKIYTEAI